MRVYSIFLISDGPVFGEQVICHILLISGGPAFGDQVRLEADWAGTSPGRWTNQPLMVSIAAQIRGMATLKHRCLGLAALLSRARSWDRAYLSRISFRISKRTRMLCGSIARLIPARMSPSRVLFSSEIFPPSLSSLATSLSCLSISSPDSSLS